MKKIIIIGLGPGSPRNVTEEARRYLTGNDPVYFRTLKHPAARYYAHKTKDRFSFDHLYAKSENFEEVYNAITKKLLIAVQDNKTICYAVPGNPSVGEATVERLRNIAPRVGIKVKIIAGLSFLEPLLNLLQIDLLDGVNIYDALAIDCIKEPSSAHLILAQVYNRIIASRVKLKLLDLYPPDYPVTVVTAAGLPRETARTVPLCNLDHGDFFNHYTTLYLSPYLAPGIGELVDLMAKLRAPDGCPWDRQQTHRSLRQYLIEEAYEVVAAIDQNNDAELKTELGDLLLQVVFHSQIAREENRFDLSEVIKAICTKLVRRHPHVFGAAKASDASEVKVLWEQIKADERNDQKAGNIVFVDHALPALLKAYKLQKKAADLGFDWPTVQGPLEKAFEELEELKEAFQNNDQAAIEEELGDYLFTIVNIARFLKVNPEMALGKTIEKFVERFKYILEQVDKSGKDIEEFNLEDLDHWWNEAKKIRKINK
ncbi:MAG: nucleoside triphosphate pyrophosphohydrolase [Bacillota bacterium]|nr:nucleoside triphosphate pyrophosphohydrolase [Bacillota bacterium]